jgi:voltage-gated potassium channel
MTPITPFGRFFTAIASFLGVGLIAIPAGIISSGMTEVVREMQNNEKKKKCPYCGTRIDSK